METKQPQTSEEEEMKRQAKEKNAISKIIENYQTLSESLAGQLSLSTPNHGLTTGTYREEIWRTLFEQMVPRKFCIDQGIFIIDSHGRISDEVDLAIFDEQYTPYIFKYGKIKFIPIEAVAVAVQCKSTGVDGAPKWAASIKRLETSINSVARTINGLNATTLENAPQADTKLAQTYTRPILILCSLCKQFPTGDELNDSFDILLNVDKEGRLEKSIPEEKRDFTYWYKQLNHSIPEHFSEDKRLLCEGLIKEGPELKRTLEELKLVQETGEENVILSLTFQLNQLLMIINNPIFFPHRSYVKMFRNHIKPAAEQAAANQNGESQKSGEGEEESHDNRSV